jgi:hypothetical protein
MTTKLKPYYKFHANCKCGHEWWPVFMTKPVEPLLCNMCLHRNAKLIDSGCKIARIPEDMDESY